MIIHRYLPDDYSNMVTVNMFGEPEYVVTVNLERRGIKEVWFYTLDDVNVVSYKKIEGDKNG